MTDELKPLAEITVPSTRYASTKSEEHPGRSCVTVRLSREELEAALEQLNLIERNG